MKKFVLSISCRSVGPGGTSVNFFPNSIHGIKGIWTNENCPYSPYPKPSDTEEWMDIETREAKDGHNVSLISWETLEDILFIAIKKGLYDPKRLRRTK